MKKKREAILRVARRASMGAELLSVEERAQLFDDLSTILPTPEAEAARDAAVYLRQTMKLQRDFLSLLQ